MRVADRRLVLVCLSCSVCAVLRSTSLETVLKKVKTIEEDILPCPCGSLRVFDKTLTTLGGVLELSL